MKRASITSWKVGATADAMVPTVKATSSQRMSFLRGQRAANAAIVGAPTTTPSAYAEMIQPACALAAVGESA